MASIHFCKTMSHVACLDSWWMKVKIQSTSSSIRIEVKNWQPVTGGYFQWAATHICTKQQQNANPWHFSATTQEWFWWISWSTQQYQIMYFHVIWHSTGLVLHRIFASLHMYNSTTSCVVHFLKEFTDRSPFVGLIFCMCSHVASVVWLHSQVWAFIPWQRPVIYRLDLRLPNSVLQSYPAITLPHCSVDTLWLELNTVIWH